MTTGVLTPEEDLVGFESPVLVTLIGLLAFKDLHLSGTLDRLRELLASTWIRNPSQLMVWFWFVVPLIPEDLLAALGQQQAADFNQVCRALPQLDFATLWPTTSRWCS